MEVRQVDYGTLQAAENFGALVLEYAKESSIEGMPAANPQHEMYRAMERTGMFHVFAAFDGEEVIGFLTMLTTILPHYGIKGATVESFFVASSHRGTGAGIKLIRHAERFAKEAGCECMMLSAPTGSRLSEVAPRVGYRHTNEIYYRGLK